MPAVDEIAVLVGLSPDRVRDVLDAAGSPAARVWGPSHLGEATGGKPFGECSREELLEACRWFWMARDQARDEAREIEGWASDLEQALIEIRRAAERALALAQEGP